MNNKIVSATIGQPNERRHLAIPFNLVKNKHHFLILALVAFMHGPAEAALIQGPSGISGVTPGGAYTFIVGSGGTANADSLIDGVANDDAYVRLAANTVLPVDFTFTLTAPSSVYGVSIWNDRGAVGDGIKDFDLQLFNAANTLLATITATLPNVTAQQQVFFGDINSPTAFNDVTSIRMIHHSFYGPGPDSAAHQWREIAFNPVLGDSGSVAYLAKSVVSSAVPDSGSTGLLLGGILGGLGLIQRRLKH